MKAIKEHIYTTLVNDGGPGGTATLAIGGVFYNRPEGINVDWSKPRITFFVADKAGRDATGTMHDEVYQFDVWSRDPDVNDVIVGRIHALFVQQAMAGLLALRVDSVVDLGEHELYEDDTRVHHKVKLIRVISFPT